MKININEFLERLDGSEGCNFREKDGKTVWKCKSGTDKSFATKILKKMKVTPKEIKEILTFAEDNGGFCDCEILFNATKALQEEYKE